jgi:hypothetical protein
MSGVDTHNAPPFPRSIAEGFPAAVKRHFRVCPVKAADGPTMGRNLFWSFLKRRDRRSRRLLAATAHQREGKERRLKRSRLSGFTGFL